MFDFNMGEIVSGMESSLLEKARTMEKINDVKELDKPIAKQIGTIEKGSGIQPEHRLPDKIGQPEVWKGEHEDIPNPKHLPKEGTKLPVNYSSENLEGKNSGKADVPANNRDVDKTSENTENKEKDDVKEVPQVVQNKLDGCRRENEVQEELEKKYPESEGYQIVKEAYLRDKDGNFVTDPETGEKRRIDFVVVKDGKVVDSVEVTSKTAPKEEQLAKEERIKENGGRYIRDNNGNLVEIPSNVKTRVERRD